MEGEILHERGRRNHHLPEIVSGGNSRLRALKARKKRVAGRENGSSYYYGIINVTVEGRKVKITEKGPNHHGGGRRGIFAYESMLSLVDHSRSPKESTERVVLGGMKRPEEIKNPN